MSCASTHVSSTSSCCCCCNYDAARRTVFPPPSVGLFAAQLTFPLRCLLLRLIHLPPSPCLRCVCIAVFFVSTLHLTREMKLWGPTYKIFRILIEAPHRPEIAVCPWRCVCAYIPKREQGRASSGKKEIKHGCHFAVFLPSPSRYVSVSWSIAAMKHGLLMRSSQSLLHICFAASSVGMPCFSVGAHHSRMTMCTAVKFFLSLLYLPALHTRNGDPLS